MKRRARLDDKIRNEFARLTVHCMPSELKIGCSCSEFGEVSGKRNLPFFFVVQ